MGVGRGVWLLAWLLRLLLPLLLLALLFLLSLPVFFLLIAVLVVHASLLLFGKPGNGEQRRAVPTGNLEERRKGKRADWAESQNRVTRGENALVTNGSQSSAGQTLPSIARTLSGKCFICDHQRVSRKARVPHLQIAPRSLGSRP